MYIIYMIHKSITIRDDQEEWLRKKHINFSRWIQSKIDEEIEKEKKEDG